MNQKMNCLYKLKIDLMKSTLILGLVFATFISYAQSEPKDSKLKEILTSSEWQSNINVFSSEDTDRYLIYIPTESNNEGYIQWGNFINFTDSTFYTSYSAPCGNDCFVSVSGRYKFVGSDKIEVFVKTIDRSGFCQAKSESPKKSFGIYQINKTDNGYEIVKEN